MRLTKSEPQFVATHEIPTAVVVGDEEKVSPFRVMVFAIDNDAHCIIDGEDHYLIQFGAEDQRLFTEIELERELVERFQFANTQPG